MNALPSQQQRNIFHGRFTVCKDILFGLLSTCLLDYADDNNSETYMLPYDSAPGGIYDLDQVSGNAISKIGPSIPVAGIQVDVKTKFCFVPTTSALDIGNNTVALTPQDLTAAYSNAARPAAPRNTPFANFITGVRENLTHIFWNGLNSKWAFQEMQQTPQNVDCLGFCQASLAIVGNAAICANSTTYSVDGLPPGTEVTWVLATAASMTSTGATSPTFTTAFTGNGSGGTGIITAQIRSVCGSVDVRRTVTIGAPAAPAFYQRDPSDMCYAGTAYYTITNYDPNLTYTIQAVGATALKDPGGFRLKRSRSGYVSFTVSVSNGCGTSTAQGDVTFDCDGQRAYAVYPNPTADELTVEQTSSASAAPVKSPAARSAARGAASTPFTVRLYDTYGTLHLEQAATTPTLRLGTRALPAGLYLLRIEAEGQVVESRQLQIAR